MVYQYQHNESSNPTHAVNTTWHWTLSLDTFTGHCTLHTGYWTLDTGDWSLGFGNNTFIIRVEMCLYQDQDDQHNKMTNNAKNTHSPSPRQNNHRQLIHTH